MAPPTDSGPGPSNPSITSRGTPPQHIHTSECIQAHFASPPNIIAELMRIEEAKNKKSAASDDEEEVNYNDDFDEDDDYGDIDIASLDDDEISEQPGYRRGGLLPRSLDSISESARLLFPDSLPSYRPPSTTAMPTASSSPSQLPPPIPHAATTSTATATIIPPHWQPNESQHPLPTQEELEQYSRSLQLKYQALAIVYIIVESYVRAYFELHPPDVQPNGIRLPRRNMEPNTTNTASTTTSLPPLLECILAIQSHPISLIPLSDLQYLYGVAFPDLSDQPSPPMPSSFEPTPLGTKRPYMPVIEPTRNAAPPTIVRDGADWERLARIKKCLEILGQQPSSSSVGFDFGDQPPMIGSPSTGGSAINQAGGMVRRPKRDVKPLPRRAQQQHSAVGTSSAPAPGSSSAMVVVDSVKDVAMGVGSVIVNGVKRLRDEFEGGSFGKWKKLRVD